MPVGEATHSINIWDKQPGESPKAYKAFETFLSMGFDRTICGAYRIYSGNKNAIGPSSTYNRWRGEFNWRERADAWDTHIRARDEAASQKTFSDGIDKYREKQIQTAKNLTNTAILMLQLANKELKQMFDNNERIGVKNIPSFVRAAAMCAQVGSAAEAQALGVEDIIKKMADVVPIEDEVE